MFFRILFLFRFNSIIFSMSVVFLILTRSCFCSSDVWCNWSSDFSLLQLGSLRSKLSFADSVMAFLMWINVIDLFSSRADTFSVRVCWYNSVVNGSLSFPVLNLEIQSCLNFFLIQFTPLNLKACYNNSVTAIGFCAWVRSCICHALYLIFTHDNTINLFVYAMYFVGVWVDNIVWPCCYVALFVLEGSVAQILVVVFAPLNNFLSIIIPMTAGPFSYTGFKLICSSNFSIKVSGCKNHWCWQGCQVIVKIAEFRWVLSGSFCCWSMHIDYCDCVLCQIFVWWIPIFRFVGF